MYDRISTLHQYDREAAPGQACNTAILSLWSLEDDYTVLVAERHFAEAGDAALLLAGMNGRRISFRSRTVARSEASGVAPKSQIQRG
jgi:hypothetical protein